jgi:hypothetical protein
MGVSVSGTSTTWQTVRRAAVTVVVLFGTFAYLFGPAASPTLHTAAASRCNDYAEGNWRSYRLSWQVGIYPHWLCADASRPGREAISLGWWTSPFGR